MGVWDQLFGTMGVRDQLFGTTVYQLFGIWDRVLGTSWLGPPFGIMHVWDHHLGPWVWGVWDQLFGTMGVLDRLFGIVFGTTVWGHRCFGPWVFGVWDHGCLGPTWTTVLGLWVFGTGRLGPPFGTTVWDHVWDHRLGPWVFGTTVFGWKEEPSQPQLPVTNPYDCCFLSV